MAEPCSTTMLELKKYLEDMIDSISWEDSITINEKQFNKNAFKLLIGNMFIYGNKVARVSHGLHIIRDQEEIRESEVEDAVKIIESSRILDNIQQH